MRGLAGERAPRMHGTWALALFAWLAIPAFAATALEPLRFVRLGISAGLSQSSVTAIAQDADDFLWIGTQDGLNRFDGYEFVTYRANPANPSALADSAVTVLAAHPDGSVWVGTRSGGLARYDPARDDFQRFRHNAVSTSLHSDYVTALAVDTRGDVWVGTERGLARIEGSASPQPRVRRLAERQVASLAAERDGVVWVGRSDGTLIRYDKAVALEIGSADRPLMPGGRSIRAIAAIPDGGAWVAGDGTTFLRLDPQGAIVARHDVRDAARSAEVRLRTLRVGTDGRLWMGGLGGGLLAFDPDTGAFMTAGHRALDPFSLSHDDVISLHQDVAGQLWIGTLGGALNRLRIESSGFVHHWHQPGDPASLSHNTVSAFAADPNGKVWVGTDGGGLNIFDIGSGVFEAVALGGDARNQGAAANRIWSTRVDRRGGVWVGTWGSGLHYRAPEALRFVRLTQVPGTAVSAIVEGSDGLWVATTDAGLMLVSAGGQVLERILEGRNVTTLQAGNSGELWIGMWSEGLFRLDLADRSLQQFKYEPNDNTTLPHNSIRGLAYDSAGAVWAATGSGLARFDRNAGTFRRFGAAQGLPEGTLYGIEIANDGRIWLSTNAGLARLDPQSESARIFGPEDGAQDFEFNGGAHLKLADGRLLFGGLTGFNVVDPSAIPAARPPGRVRLIEVSLTNRPMAPRSRDPDSALAVAATRLEELTIGHRDNVIGFRFVSPLPSAPSQLRYAYQLEGFDEEWQRVSVRERHAVYTNLPTGRYTFRMRAANADGVWGDSERIVSLRVNPPWWASYWAFGLYITATVLSLIAFIQWRTRALRMRAELLCSQVAEQTAQLAQQTRLVEDQARHLQHALETKERLFARVSHEFRTPLTLIVAPIDALLADQQAGQTAAWLRLMRRSARRLLSLVDQLLGLARLSGEAPVRPTPQRLAPIVRGTLAAFDSLAVSRDVSLELEHLDDVWAGATAEMLERMLTNLVSNAVKFTPRGGHVRVAVRGHGAMVSIEVADDGAGIPLEEQEAIFEPFRRFREDAGGSGIGLALVRECAQVLGGSVTLESEPGKGARFSIQLPACAPPPVASGDEADEVAQSERMLLEAEVAANAAKPHDDLAHALMPIVTATGDDRPRVLIVEDHADLRALLLAALAPGYRCTTAENGRRGIAASLEDPPDLIVSDVMMPEADGFELTRTLKRDARTSHVPIVLLTALGDRDSRLQGLDEHADEYLVKPFDADELRLRVRNLIETRRIIGQRAALGLFEPTPNTPEPASEAAVTLGPREQAFLDRLRAAAENGHANHAFGVAELASRVAMSERQLQRKLQALLALGPADYLREVRLQKAATLLRTGQPAGNVAFDVGFGSPSHFGACFKARFGVPPGEYAQTRS